MPLVIAPLSLISCIPMSPASLNPQAKITDLTVEEFRQLMAEFVLRKEHESRKLLNIHQVANLLGYKVSNIYALTHKRLIPFMKKGRRLWFDEIEILTWVESAKMKTLSELQHSVSIEHGKMKIIK